MLIILSNTFHINIPKNSLIWKNGLFSQKVAPIISHGYIGWVPGIFQLRYPAISQSFKCPEQNLMPWISEISLRKLLLLFISTQIRRGMLGGNWGSRLKRTGGFLLEQCRLLQLFKVISVQIEINLARPQFLCQKHTQKQTGPGLNPHCCNLKFFLLKGPRRCKEHDYTSGKKKQVLRRKSAA